jgi:hypothetical protein
MLRLWAWGANNAGQLGLGFSSEQVGVPAEVHDPSIIAADDGGGDLRIEIGGGGSHTTILKSSPSTPMTLATVHLGLVSTKSLLLKNQIISPPTAAALLNATPPKARLGLGRILRKSVKYSSNK